MPDDNDNDLVSCGECNAEINEDDSFTTNNGEIVCSDCIRLCEYCESVGTTNDDWCSVDSE